MKSGPSTIQRRAMYSSTTLFILYVFGLSKSGLVEIKSMKREVIIFAHILGSCSQHLFFLSENTSNPPP